MSLLAGAAKAADERRHGRHHHRYHHNDQTAPAERPADTATAPSETTTTTAPASSAPATLTGATTTTAPAASTTLTPTAPSATFYASLPNPSGGDDTAAINAVLASAPAGSVIYAPGGNTWQHNGIIEIKDCTLQGNGDTSVLLATDTSGNPNLSVVLTGTKPGLSYLKLTTLYPTGENCSPGDGSGNGYRTSNSYGHMVYVARGTTGWLIDHVHMIGGASGGIYCAGTGAGLASNCAVEYALADGIGLYEGTSNAKVQACTVTGCGDDGISIVSYTSDTQSTGNIITGNTVTGGYWGRGITDVGGSGSQITNNAIVGYFAAGLWIAQDNGAGTYAPSGGLADSNTVSNCAAPASGYRANFEVDGPTTGYTLSNNKSVSPQEGDYFIASGCQVACSNNQPLGTGA